MTRSRRRSKPNFIAWRPFVPRQVVGELEAPATSGTAAGRTGRRGARTARSACAAARRRNAGRSARRVMPYCAFASMPNAGWIESERTLFHEPRNSLNTDEPKTRDQPPTKFWPRLRMSLAKSPDATGSFEDRRLVPIGVLEAVAAEHLIAVARQRVIDADVELIDVVVEDAVRDEVVVEEARARARWAAG